MVASPAGSWGQPHGPWPSSSLPVEPSQVPISGGPGLACAGGPSPRVPWVASWQCPAGCSMPGGTGAGGQGLLKRVGPHQGAMQEVGEGIQADGDGHRGQALGEPQVGWIWGTQERSGQSWERWRRPRPSPGGWQIVPRTTRGQVRRGMSPVYTCLSFPQPRCFLTSPRLSFLTLRTVCL